MRAGAERSTFFGFGGAGRAIQRRSSPIQLGRIEMWEARKQLILSGVRYELFEDDSPLSFRKIFSLLETNLGFVQWYSDTLAASPFAAFFWEHPPLTSERFDGDAEFVLIESASLAKMEPDSGPFEQHFAGQLESDVITFPNLLGDAVLVVPRPIAAIGAYPHLATFVRNAPNSQVAALWNATGKALRETLNPRPTWLSTAGLGVSWLHLRLDAYPKYYRYEPYKAPPAT